MANARDSSTASSLDSLVRQIIEHPDFKHAVNTGTSSSVPSTCSGGAVASSSGFAAPSSSGGSVNSRTPREELRQIFHRRNASAPPQFQGRTNWQPAARGRGRQPCSSGGKRSQSTQGGKGKGKCPKTSTFSREVVLLKTPNDGMVRGAAKAELLRMGHVISHFQFDKSWPANVVVENLLSAFETSVPSLAEITCEPK